MKKLLFSLLAGTTMLATLAAAEKPTLQWPFDRPAEEALRAMDKKVFAHYFSQFPISIDNRNPDSDYYAKGYMHPDGENGKHRAYGKFVNERPIPRMPRPEPNWDELDVYDEVRMAAETGMDGFAYNMLSSRGEHWNKLQKLMKQVNKYGRNFKILLMPDMTAEFHEHPERMLPAILAVAKDPSIYRDPSGKLVIAPYNAYAQSPEWWTNQLAKLKEAGEEVVFIPGFQGWWKYLKDYKALAWGFFDWGCNAYDEQVEWRDKALQTVDRYGKAFMAPVRPQDTRPRAGCGGEARNSGLFRAMWQTAIDRQAPWVQLITWSDYSESSEIAPSTGIRWAFYDLTAYYTTYFKTGKPPKITRDAIYYFHRLQNREAAHNPEKQKNTFRTVGKLCDEIELLGFLKAPATLRIQLNGKVHEKAFPAGMHSFRIPLEEGRPEFSLVRQDKTLIQLKSNWTISNKFDYTNLLYHADGGTAEAPRTWNGPVERKFEPEFGKLIRAIDTLSSAKTPMTEGDVAALKMPIEKAALLKGGNGALGIAGGGGGKDISVTFKDLALPDNTELVFHVKRLDYQPEGGWVAFFLSAHTADGKARFSLTPRNSAETYISASAPDKPFFVARGNFDVKYPAIYRIRRSGGKLQLVYGNYPMYTVDESEFGKLDRLELHISAEKPQGGGAMEFSAIELRELPKE